MSRDSAPPGQMLHRERLRRENAADHKVARSHSEGGHRMMQTLTPTIAEGKPQLSPGQLHSSRSDLYRLHSSVSSSIDKSSLFLNLVECIDFYDVGHVLGETGILKRKDNEIDAICETDVQVFLIKKKDLEHLMLAFPVLKDRMWKILGVHIASSLLIKQDEYQVSLVAIIKLSSPEVVMFLFQYIF